MRYHLITLGCQMNLSDGERIHTVLKEMGLVQSDYQLTYEAFVPIQNGCDKFCTFCAVPYTRGREVSRPSGDIINQVKDLIQQGYKSITLLGQNVNSYGLDKKGSELNFAQLLREIGQAALQMDQMCWIYFTSPHPRDMSDEVIEAIAAYPHLANQIHLPLHGKIPGDSS